MDKMRKYREAFRAIQQSYEIWIDRLNNSEHESFTYHNDKLFGLKEVAIYDTDISVEEFWEINNYEIKRRENA